MQPFSGMVKKNNITDNDIAFLSDHSFMCFDPVLIDEVECQECRDAT
jgi:hypothetical protein